MIPVHLVQLLRTLNHPALQELVEMTDRFDLLDNQAESVADRVVALSASEWNSDSMQELTQLQQQYTAISQQFWPAFHALYDLQERIVQSLNTPEHRSYQEWTLKKADS
jgi:hypothetical protein